MARCFLTVGGLTVIELEILLINLKGLCNADGQAFVQCSIPVQSHVTKEIAVIHSGQSANAINNFISSLDLKGKYLHKAL